MYSKFKDRDPLETANKFYEKLLSLGLDLSIEFDNVADCVYSCTVKADNIDFKTHGKGTSEIYALSSGLGEMVERIQCNIGLGCSDFFVDSKDVDINEIFQHFPSLGEQIKQSYLFGSDAKEFNLENAIKCLKKIRVGFPEENKVRCVPFYSTKEECVKYLPIDIIKKISGSNGNSSGNTDEECLVQAISELIERYTFNKILSDKLTPPRIDNDWIRENSFENYERLEKLHNKTNFELEVYDCSLGRGFPCVCLVAIDKKEKKYSVFAGAHPIFNIALERCITEMFQNVSDETLFIVMRRSRSIFNKNTISNELIEKRFATNHNFIRLPYEFFGKIPSWKFTKWEIDDRTFDNKSGVKHLIHLLEQESDETVYIRNLSFLGIPTFFVYSPKLSIKTPFGEKVIASRDFVNLLDEYANSKNKICLSDKIKFIEQFKSIAFDARFPSDTNLLIASIYYDLKKYDDALLFLNGSNGVFVDIVQKEIEMVRDGVDEENRDLILSKFFDEDRLNRFRKNWRQLPVFENLISGGSTYMNTYKTFNEGRERFRNVLLNKILNNKVDQENISRILKS